MLLNHYICDHKHFSPEEYSLEKTSKQHEPLSLKKKIQIKETTTTSRNRVKLLEKHTEERPNFHYLVSKLYKKASNRINALTIICKHMDQIKEKRLWQSSIKFHFSYCPWMWMFIVETQYILLIGCMEWS